MRHSSSSDDDLGDVISLLESVSSSDSYVELARRLSSNDLDHYDDTGLLISKIQSDIREVLNIMIRTKLYKTRYLSPEGQDDTASSIRSILDFLINKYLPAYINYLDKVRSSFTTE